MSAFVLVAALMGGMPFAPPATSPQNASCDEQCLRSALTIVTIAYAFIHESPMTTSGLPGVRIQNTSFQETNLRLAYEQRRQQASEVFHSAYGAAWLARVVRVSNEQYSIMAMLEVLYESRQPVALEVFKEFQGHTNRVVMRRAKYYLKRLSKKR
jgi:hypothetical protein